MSIINKRLIFNAIPKDFPKPGETTVIDSSSTIDPNTAELNGGFLSKILYFSIDPYMRGRMRDPKIKSYSPAYELGKPITGHGIAKVLRSDDPNVPQGSLIVAIFPFHDYVLAKWSDLGVPRIIHNTANIPLHHYVGYAGMPGKTAYYGWKKYIEPKARKGQTFFISTAAGPVGSVLVQLAKSFGLKVIGSTGSEAKIAYLESLGVDVPVNYKTQNLREVLQKEGPVNFYWDHVGGDTLNAALENMELFGIIVLCGLIDGYNTGHNPLTSYYNILSKRLTIRGHMIWDLEAEFVEDFYAKVPQMIASGEIKTIVHEYAGGLEDAGKAILDVQKGDNKGKAFLTLARE